MHTFKKHLCLHTHFWGRSVTVQRRWQKICDQPTDQPTDLPTDLHLTWVGARDTYVSKNWIHLRASVSHPVLPVIKQEDPKADKGLVGHGANGHLFFFVFLYFCTFVFSFQGLAWHGASDHLRNSTIPRTDCRLPLWSKRGRFGLSLKGFVVLGLIFWPDDWDERLHVSELNLFGVVSSHLCVDNSYHRACSHLGPFHDRQIWQKRRQRFCLKSGKPDSRGPC